MRETESIAFGPREEQATLRQKVVSLLVAEGMSIEQSRQFLVLLSFEIISTADAAIERINAQPLSAVVGQLDF